MGTEMTRAGVHEPLAGTRAFNTRWGGTGASTPLEMACRRHGIDPPPTKKEMADTRRMMRRIKAGLSPYYTYEEYKRDRLLSER